MITISRTGNRIELSKCIEKNEYRQVFQTFAVTKVIDRKRFVYKHGIREYFEAKDFTTKMFRDKDLMLYTVYKYFPELKGRVLGDDYNEFGVIGSIETKEDLAIIQKEKVEKIEKVYKENDILKCSWGWEQTNIDYYQVVKRSDTALWLQEIGKEIVSQDVDHMSKKNIPNPDEKIGKVFRRKINIYEGAEQGVSINSYSGASLWSGSPSTSTHYA